MLMTLSLGLFPLKNLILTYLDCTLEGEKRTHTHTHKQNCDLGRPGQYLQGLVQEYKWRSIYHLSKYLKV